MYEKLIEMVVHGVVVDAISNSTILLLTDKKKDKLLPIWIGAYEAFSISQVLEKHIMERPITHDLIVNILTETQNVLERVVIYTIKNNTFYSYLAVTMHNGRKVRVDSRPSDAIAIALRVPAPIFISEEIHRVTTSFQEVLGQENKTDDDGIMGMDSQQLKDWLKNIKPSDFL